MCATIECRRVVVTLANQCFSTELFYWRNLPRGKHPKIHFYIAPTNPEEFTTKGGHSSKTIRTWHEDSEVDFACIINFLRWGVLWTLISYSWFLWVFLKFTRKKYTTMSWWNHPKPNKISICLVWKILRLHCNDICSDFGYLNWLIRDYLFRFKCSMNHTLRRILLNLFEW